MSGNREQWLTYLDPMMAKLTGNDYAEKHGEEIDTAAALAAIAAATYFTGGAALGVLGGAEAAGAGTAEGAGLTAAELAAMDAGTVGYAGAGSLAGAEAAAGAGSALSAAEIASMYGGNTAGLLSAAPEFAAYASPMELEAGGGGMGGGLLQPGGAMGNAAESMSAPRGLSAWDRIGKGLDTYNKFSKATKPIQGLLAPPQSPQLPQPRPLTQQQAKQQPGPVDWAAAFGPGLSDEEIQRRYLAALNGYNG